MKHAGWWGATGVALLVMVPYLKNPGVSQRRITLKPIIQTGLTDDQFLETVYNLLEPQVVSVERAAARSHREFSPLTVNIAAEKDVVMYEIRTAAVRFSFQVIRRSSQTTPQDVCRDIFDEILKTVDQLIWVHRAALQPPRILRGGIFFLLP